MARFVSLLIAFLICSDVAAQVEFTSSNLPIILIDTDGEHIPREKITARMSVIDGGPGVRNAPTDPPKAYSGTIGIEQRGSSSTLYPKWQYGIETRDASGANRNVSLLGLPGENDWIINGPYGDKTLMRNAIAFHIFRSMGQYSSRARFAEVVINGDYQGVYVLLEKVKRDDERVDVARLHPSETSGDDLTGGYIIQIDRSNAPGWFSRYYPASDTSATLFYQLRSPSPDRAAPEQLEYIQRWMGEFEDAMASESFADPEFGYPAYIDVGSFVDYILATEVVFDPDGYRLSTYLHKDKDSNDPLLHAGPGWDFNFALANNANRVEGYQFDVDYSWSSHEIAFWWPKLAHEPVFRVAMTRRWLELREGPLHTDSLLAYIDSTAAMLEESQTRNFERWPIHGVYVYPNVFVGDSYAEDVEHMRSWLIRRLEWIDRDLGPFVASSQPRDAPTEPRDACASGVGAVYPNPARGRARLDLCLPTPGSVAVDVYDARGRRVSRTEVNQASRIAQVDVPLDGMAPGAYMLRVSGPGVLASRRLTVLGP